MRRHLVFIWFRLVFPFDHECLEIIQQYEILRLKKDSKRNSKKKQRKKETERVRERVFI